MNLISVAPTEQLPALVDRAMSALALAKDSAAVLEARDMARVVYDAAKSAGRLARAKEAHDTVLAQVYRAQADALLIEARAKMRLAEEYDAAQERGEVRSKADNHSNSKAEFDKASVTDIGLTHKDIHEARQIRDAEVADPGVTQRTLNEIVERGEEPTKAVLPDGSRLGCRIFLRRLLIGQSTHSRVLISKCFPNWGIFLTGPSTKQRLPNPT